jgi:hypothetical protein
LYDDLIRGFVVLLDVGESEVGISTVGLRDALLDLCLDSGAEECNCRADSFAVVLLFLKV